MHNERSNECRFFFADRRLMLVCDPMRLPSQLFNVGRLQEIQNTVLRNSVLFSSRSDFDHNFHYEIVALPLSKSLVGPQSSTYRIPLITCVEKKNVDLCKTTSCMHLKQPFTTIHRQVSLSTWDIQNFQISMCVTKALMECVVDVIFCDGLPDDMILHQHQIFDILQRTRFFTDNKECEFCVVWRLVFRGVVHLGTELPESFWTTWVSTMFVLHCLLFTPESMLFFPTFSVELHCRVITRGIRVLCFPQFGYHHTSTTYFVWSDVACDSRNQYLCVPCDDSVLQPPSVTCLSLFDWVLAEDNIVCRYTRFGQIKEWLNSWVGHSPFIHWFRRSVVIGLSKDVLFFRALLEGVISYVGLSNVGRNMSLFLWPPWIDKALCYPPNTCSSLPWVIFHDISSQIWFQCGDLRELLAAVRMMPLEVFYDDTNILGGEKYIFGSSAIVCVVLRVNWLQYQWYVSFFPTTWDLCFKQNLGFCDFTIRTQENVPN